MSIYNADLSGT